MCGGVVSPWFVVVVVESRNIGSNFRGEESGQTPFLVLTGPLSIRILSSLLSHLRSPASMCVIHSSGALLVACLVGWWNGMSSRQSYYPYLPVLHNIFFLRLTMD